MYFGFETLCDGFSIEIDVPIRSAFLGEDEMQAGLLHVIYRPLGVIVLILYINCGVSLHIQVFGETPHSGVIST